MSTWLLALGLFGVIVGATAVGHLVGRSKREHSDGQREPFAVLQGALVGFMGLVLAFGISLAVGRYEARRAAVVAEANAIGTTYLRAQTLDEPVRTQSLALLPIYTDTSIRISQTVPSSADEQEAVAQSGGLQRQLWALAGDALRSAPAASAPRLYVESLNETFDSQSTRVYGLRNRVPTAVLALEVIGAAIALGALAVHLATLGRGWPTVLLAALFVALTLLVTFDLDRPTRGLIRIPAEPLTQLRTSMNAAPASAPLSGR
ncbi:MAG TPA: hypothetical protein VIY28_05695 [Pseudonocardiaceae bacterium]